jgi:NAD(P)-dependent dehydrogenase (short-subunit alcohol dehydrogenase family)
MATAIIIGVGPDQGLGAQLCKRFAAEGLNVLVAGRTKPALDAVVADIVAAGGRATAVVADATVEADIVALFDKAGADLELAIYNAGNNTPGKIIDMEAGYFEQSWRVVCFGGFLFGREAVRRLVPKGSGSLLFTGASASLRGRSGYGAFNSSKAGLRTLAQAMAKEYAADGIHVGHVVVDGPDRRRENHETLPRRRRPRGAPDQHRRDRRWLRFPAQAAAPGLVVRTRRADVARELVT